MKKKTKWESLKQVFGAVKETKETISNEWSRRQFLELSRLGGNPIVMRMGN